MTEQEKHLLLADLCARLPYRVIVQKLNEAESAFELYSINKESGEIKYYKYRGKSLEIGDAGFLFRTNGIPRFKPYLRPMSSMTEEEEVIYEQLIKDVHYKPRESTCCKLISWLNENYFDYNYLIEKGLAIAVTDNNNPYKE